jgi:hypothetical protein
VRLQQQMERGQHRARSQQYPQPGRRGFGDVLGQAAARQHQLGQARPVHDHGEAVLLGTEEPGQQPGNVRVVARRGDTQQEVPFQRFGVQRTGGRHVPRPPVHRELPEHVHEMHRSQPLGGRQRGEAGVEPAQSVQQHGGGAEPVHRLGTAHVDGLGATITGCGKELRWMLDLIGRVR